MFNFICNFGIKGKILAVVSLSLVAFLSVSGVLIYSEIKAVKETKSLELLANFAPKVSALVHEMQKERGASAVNISSKGNFTEVLNPQRKDTDIKFKDFEVAIENFPISDYGKVFANRIKDSQKRLTKLKEIRRGTTNLTISVPQMAKYFTTTISSMLSIIETTSALSTDAKLTSQITTYLSILHEKERSGRERAMGAVGFGAGQFSNGLYNKFVNLLGQQTGFHKMYSVYAEPSQLEFYKKTMDNPITAEVQRMRDIALKSNETESLAGITGSYWYKTITAKINLLKQVEDNVAKDLVGLMAQELSHEYQNLIFWVIFCVAMLVLCLSLTIFVVSRILRPVHIIVEEFSHLANYDLTRNIEVKSQDEIGTMSERFNELVVKLSGIIGSVRGASSQMATAAEEMSSNMAETSAMVSSQTTATSQITEAVRDSSQTAQEISTLAESTQKNVVAISSSTENANVCMKGLQDNSGQIVEVLGVIRDIADQVNLLALNAAIEAARAGDAGRGFAVVADEVRKLANHTTQATEDIDGAVKSLQENVGSTDDALGEITTSISSISGEMEQITGSLTQQSAAIEEISATVESFSSQSENMSRSIKEMEEVSASIAKESSELDSQVGNFKLS